MKLPVKFSNTDEAIRRITQAINVNADGETGTITLTANAASTTMTDVRLTASSVITFMPTTANAAGALATTYIGTRAIGSATITHTNNAQADKTFAYSLK